MTKNLSPLGEWRLLTFTKLGLVTPYFESNRQITTVKCLQNALTH
jgi:hypothetical protein